MEEENLEPLVTQCPHCKTRFRVTEQQLQVASGRVRCGACLAVFQGVEHLVWEEPSEFESSEEAQHALDALLEELDTGDARAGPEMVSGGETADQGPVWMSGDSPLYGGHEGPSGIVLEENHWPGAAARAEPPPAADAAGEPAESVRSQPGDADAPGKGASSAQRSLPGRPPPEPWVPEQDSGPPGPGRVQPGAGGVAASQPRGAQPLSEPTGSAAGASTQMPAGAAQTAAATDREEFAFGDAPKRRWWVGPAIVLAGVALCLQVLWFQFERWSVDPQMRPLYELGCELLGCQLPIMRDLDRLMAKNLVVRSHPDVAGALVVNAVIVNQAEFAQPFPVLELKFTALQGELVAGRQFKPEEYLAGELLGARMLARNVPVHVELAIEDPGPTAVNYFLTFR